MNEISLPYSSTHPHYTDEHFRHARLIWGRDEEVFWVYSDRLEGHERWDDAIHTANAKHLERSPAWYQLFLQALYDKPLTLVGIKSGWNWGNGYPYRVYGIRFEEEISDG